MRTIVRFILLIPALGSTAMAAETNPFGIATYVPAQPREDSAALARLAPPSNRATARTTYGDATFARRPGSSFDSARRLSAEERTVVRARCRAQTARAAYLECMKAASAFFRKNYIYTPAYVSAPQVFDQPPHHPSPVTSPVTALFLDPFRILD